MILLSLIKGTTKIFSLSNLLKYQLLPVNPLLITLLEISFLSTPLKNSLKYLKRYTFVIQDLFSVKTLSLSGVLCWFTIQNMLEICDLSFFEE